ncbi:MAG: hypothetical protein KGI97_06150, partial [Alphaproteobacteria bacterium]|nr:hypothetical protein [Alphaproteobacteria bacterium]
GKWKLATGKKTRDMAGIYAVRLNAAALTLRNGGAQPLTVTFAARGEAPRVKPVASIAAVRRIYRINGVALSPQARPAPGETYIVEVKGRLPALKDGVKILLHDGAGAALRPVSCALPKKLDTLSFLPWLDARTLSFLDACAFTPYGIDAALSPDGGTFRIAYFAHIDADSAAALPPPDMRVVAEDGQ